MSGQEAELQARLRSYETLLDASRETREPRVETDALRRLCARGIPDHPSHIRPLAYALLLGTLPADKKSWKSTASKQRSKYYDLVRAFMDEIDIAPPPEEPHTPDDALALRIAKDIDRLDLPVLRGRTSPPRSSPLAPAGEAASEATSSSDGGDDDRTQHGESQDRATPRRNRPRARLPPIPTRRALFNRIDTLMADLYKPDFTKGKRRETLPTPRIVLSGGDRAERERAPPPPTPSLRLTIPEGEVSGPSSPITLLSPQAGAEPLSEPTSPVSPTTASTLPDTHTEVLSRIIYVFSKAHTDEYPYSPNIVDILVPLYLVFCEANVPKAQRTGRSRYAEEETYWAFSALMREFGGLVCGLPGDNLVTSSLARLGNRVRWADEPLWLVLKERNLDPALPLYTFRWLTSLMAHDRANLIPIWDFLFAQPPATPGISPKLDLLLDMCVALVVMVKNQVVYAPPKQHPQSPKRNLWVGAEDTDIPGDPEDPDAAFVRCLQLFRNYPLDQVGGVWMLLNTAFELNQARRATIAAGEDPDRASWAEARDAALNRKGWAATKLRQAAQGASASTGRLWSSYAQSDAAAQLSRASTNLTANAMAKWQAVPPPKAPQWKAPDWKGMSAAAAGRLWKKKEDDEGSVSGEEYEFNHSLPSTPGRLESPAVPPKSISSEKRGSYPLGLTAASLSAVSGASSASGRKRSDSVASNLSVTSLQDRLSGLAATLGAGGTPQQPQQRVTSGPRPLLLSSAARRASNSHLPPSRSRSPTPSMSDRPGLTSPQQREGPLYPIGAGNRNSMGPMPRSPNRTSIDSANGTSPLYSFNPRARSSRGSVDSTTPYESDASTARSFDGAPIAARGLSFSPIEHVNASPPMPMMPTVTEAMSAPATGAVSDKSWPSAPPVPTPPMPESTPVPKTAPLTTAAASTPSPEPEEATLELPTPQIGHLTDEDYEHVYEPAEDSFILLDALEADARAIRAAKPALCVEIGSGSGIASAFVGTMLVSNPAAMMSTDINPYAVNATLRTGEANGVLLNPILGNLLAPAAHRMEGKVDMLIFNPPYVETEEAEMTATQEGRDIGGAWAGGNFGMSVTNLVLERVPALLAPGGRFYLVAIHQNKPDEIIARMRAQGLECKTVIKRRAGRELLSVIRMVRPASSVTVGPTPASALAPRKTLNMPAIAEAKERPSPVDGAENALPVAATAPKTPVMAGRKSPASVGRSPGRSPRLDADGGDADDEDEDYGELLDAYGA